MSSHTSSPHFRGSATAEPPFNQCSFTRIRSESFRPTVPPSIVRGDGSKVEFRGATPEVRVRLPVAAPPWGSPWRGRMQEGIHRLGSARKGRAGVRAPALSPIFVDRLSFRLPAPSSRSSFRHLGVAQPGIERSVRDRKVAGSNPATQTPPSGGPSGRFGAKCRSTVDRSAASLRFFIGLLRVLRAWSQSPQERPAGPTSSRCSPCARLSSPPG